MLCIILTEIEEMSMCLVMFCSMVGLIWMFGFQFFYIFLQFIPGWWFGTFFFPIQLTFMFFRGVGLNHQPIVGHPPRSIVHKDLEMNQYRSPSGSCGQKPRVFELQMATKVA